jgi:hypothetical protein
MSGFLTSNSWQMRLARTILQGVIGVLIANIDLLIGYTAIPPELRPVIVGVVMAVLSPIMAMLGGKDDDTADY